MGLRMRHAWAVALLAVAVMVLAPGRAVADELEPGELKSVLEGRTAARLMDAGALKARMESFSVSLGSQDALDPGQFKAIVEAPARFDVVDPGEFKALTEARVWPTETEVASDQAAPSSLNVTTVTIAVLALLIAAGVGIVFARKREDRIAPA